ncbi:Tim44 domain-containing protein [Vibrio tapetis]|uniref:Putative translocase, subunit Tim44 n=1 Tax=Vibrio tapetis subsp. tapetis TaxID=1671868 RepID=A0A2N8ZB88_9VIBR|nr:TIM44-like domain-containing protein [Vibrio tapetis]SON49157.1 putative translocase, subunit Tim44 [Vibrio tapetis subsp. tapetis]
MKRLFTIVALLMISVTAAPIAEAKKFGGGKSFGKSFKTAPAPKQNATNTSTINQNKATNSKKGLMGGLMGGLLAGGLLAAFFGGAFEGIQFMDILIMGLIAFVAFKFLKGMLGAKQGTMRQGQQPAYSGGSQDMFKSKSEPESNVHNFEQSQPTSGGFGSATGSDVPHNFPPGFDQAAFINGSREHYRTIQGAWNHNQLETIEEYVSPSLFADLKLEREKLDGDQHTNVMYVDAEIVRAEYDASMAQLSLQFSGRYRDDAESVEEDITDVWHLERDLAAPNAPWLIVGIQA